MQEQPLVSILMTVYNREKYIDEAIESVINSTYQNWELIISDDQSKDYSVKIAKKYEATDERIKVFINEINLGDYPNRNKAASYAKGKYIKYLDSDDIIYPYGLEVMVSAMEMFPQAAYGLSYSMVHDSKAYPFMLSSEEAYKEHFLNRGLFNEGPTSLIFKTEIFRKEGGFKIFKVYGDTEMLLRLSTRYPMIKMQPALTWWRQHEEQEFGLKRNEYFNGVYQLNKSFLESNACPLNSFDKLKALDRLKQHHARKILTLGIKGSVKMALEYYKNSALSFTELLRGFGGYN